MGDAQTVVDHCYLLDQQFPNLGLQMFLDYTFQKSYPTQLAAKAFGCFGSKSIWGPRVENHCVLDCYHAKARFES